MTADPFRPGDMAQDWPLEPDESDPLAVARGVFWGTVLSLPLWGLIVWVVS